MIDIEQLARDCGGEFDESGGIDFRRKAWGFFAGEIRDHMSLPDAKLVSLFYAAQGSITQFRIKAREILEGKA